MQANDRIFFDFLKAREIVFHLHGGYTFSLPVTAIDPEMDFGPGKVLDTSEIDGKIHYFPVGNS